MCLRENDIVFGEDVWPSGHGVLSANIDRALEGLDRLNNLVSFEFQKLKLGDGKGLRIESKLRVVCSHDGMIPKKGISKRSGSRSSCTTRLNSSSRSSKLRTLLSSSFSSPLFFFRNFLRMLVARHIIFKLPALRTNVLSSSVLISSVATRRTFFTTRRIQLSAAASKSASNPTLERSTAPKKARITRREKKAARKRAKQPRE